MRYEQPSFAGGEIGPPLYSRIDTAKYQTALKRCRNFLVQKYGGVTRRPGTLMVGTIAGKTGDARLIPFRFSSDQAYVLEFTDEKMRVIKDGAYVLSASPKSITGITQASPGVVTSAAHGFTNGAEVYLAGVVGMTQLNGRTLYVANATTNTFTLTDVNGQDVSTTAMGGYVSGGTATMLYELASPYVAADLLDIRYEQSADVMYLAHTGYAPHKLVRTDHNAWTISAVTFETSLAAPTGVTATPSGGGSGKTYEYQVTALNTETGDESVASVMDDCVNNLPNDGGGDDNKNTITWSAVTGADRYRVYKRSGGILGFIGSTDQLSLIDDGIDQDTTDTPPEARNPFEDPDDYPGAVTFFEQRLCWGNSNNKPNGFWSSRSGSFENMNVSYPTRDDDAITAGLVAREVNVVQHLIPLEDLLAITSASVFRINGGGQSDFISPGSFISRPQAYRGFSRVRPAVIDSVVLCWQARGAQLRSLGYQFDTDGYRGSDLTIFAPHLFKRRRIVDQAYTQQPLSTLWAVGDDGALYALTWELEQDVWGWSKCELPGGAVLSVASIPQDDEDTLYMIVERTIDGVSRRYVERLASTLWSDVADAVFLDSAITYSGAPEDTFAGLEHLEGEEVIALGDGAVYGGLTVAGGAVTLPRACSTVVIGLSFVSLMEVLPPGFSMPNGSIQGLMKAQGKVVIRVEDTRGLSYGLTEGDLMDVRDRTDDDPLDAPPALRTDDLEVTLPPRWKTNATFVIVQSNPLPATINGVFPEMSLGG